MYCQCMRDVSWMYYVSNSHVSLMYYGCIGRCTPHLCFPPYAAHHLFRTQPSRASSFGHQQAVGLAPHALLGSVQQKQLLVRHPHGDPTLHAPGLTHWAAVGDQT